MANYSRISRRQFLARTAAVGAALAVPWYLDTRSAFAFYQTTGLQKFAQPLRGVGPGGIPVAATDGTAPATGATHYSFTIRQFTDQLHPNLGPTTLWGYNPAVALGGGSQPQKHLGGIIVAERGTPIQLTFTNTLPSQHILPVDTSANFTDAQKRQNATTTHLHGGFVPWISDGGPFSWFTPDGKYGPSVMKGGPTSTNC
jgi:FtsP/CotA-like multicopper oxidase with cupredoxin domain